MKTPIGTRRQALLAGLGLSLAIVIVTLAYVRWNQPSVDLNREYRIGSDDAYPYHAVSESGEERGFAVEILNEAAKRRGIRLRWVRTKGRALEALRTGEVDLWPVLSPESRQIEPSIHLSERWIHNDFALVAVRDEFRNSANAAKIRTVVFRDQPNARRLAKERFPGAVHTGVATRAEAVSKVCAGEADGAVLELRSAYVFMATPPPPCRGRPPCFVGLTFEGEELAVAGRGEFKGVVDLLRAEIDRMSADGTNERVLLPWSYFQSNEVQSMYQERQMTKSLLLVRVLLGISVLLLALLGTQYILLRRVLTARDRANEESWAKTRFMRKMSHELRTPLNGIVGGADLLRYTRMEEEQAECVGLIRDSGETMLRLVQDLLDLSKATNGTLPIQNQPFQLREWMAKTLARFVPQANARGLRMDFAGFEELYPGVVSGDSIRVGQVLNNLVSNALKFTTQGTVRVEASTEETQGKIWLEVAVIDSGPGIEKSRLPGIFEDAVFRDRIDSPDGGIGLGLSISSELVREMGGTIEAESEFGTSSTFRFRVPLMPLREEETSKSTAIFRDRGKL